MGCRQLTYSQYPDQESSPFLEVWKKERLENADAHFLGTLEEKSRAENFCDSYLPFGLAFNSWYVSPKNQYMFQGEEHQDETGCDQFKWRNSDPTIGRFFNIDPLAESFYYNSPYAFSENKVTAHVELEGAEALGFMNFFIQTNAVAHATSGGDPSTKDYVRAGFQVAFGSTLIGSGLNNISAGAQRRVANDVDFMRNGGNQIEQAVSNGGDPSDVIQSHKVDNMAADAQIVVGFTEVAASVMVEGGGSVVAGNLTPSNTAAALDANAQFYSNALNGVGETPSTVVAASSPDGTIVLGRSGLPNGVAGQLESPTNALGPIGVKNSAGTPVGCCSEFNAANQLLQKDPSLTPSQIQFSPAYRPRRGNIIKTCDNCKTLFDLE